jgi:hypothetical protein
METEAPIRAGVYDLLSWSHISEQAPEKVRSIRWVTYPAGVGGGCDENCSGLRKLQGGPEIGFLEPLQEDLRGNMVLQ